MNEPALILNSKYGYKLNLNNLRVRSLYERYKKKKSIPNFVALNQIQREDFERNFIGIYSKVYLKKFGEPFLYPGHDYQRERMNALIDSLDIPQNISAARGEDVTEKTVLRKLEEVKNLEQYRLS